MNDKIWRCSLAGAENLIDPGARGRLVLVGLLQQPLVAVVAGAPDRCLLCQNKHVKKLLNKLIARGCGDLL